ncbi:MAG: LPXTG cell wall anchor domain-containing protein [Lactobacillales bacterium]|nr:LPXTG cell wall anchor domain-containing protein [Lactobacillales bacterium]
MQEYKLPATGETRNLKFFIAGVTLYLGALIIYFRRKLYE